jgi:hypothetical protein
MYIKICDSYSYANLNVGAVLRREADSAEVYFQPGDDATSFRETISALLELDDCEKAAHIAFDAYFDHY